LRNQKNKKILTNIINDTNTQEFRQPEGTFLRFKVYFIFSISESVLWREFQGQYTELTFDFFEFSILFLNFTKER